MQRNVEKSGAAADVNQAPTGEKFTDAGQSAPETGGQASDDKSREQLVREAAYRRFQARGSEHGRHEEDWLEAENEVRPPDGN
jgi:hypothetical protein